MSPPRQPKPEWLKVRAPGSPSYLRLKGLMRELNLHTVCEEAQCPNIGECWNHGTATFMILGDVCTRACSYCAVSHGRPLAVDTAEPSRVAGAIGTLDLDYVVITSVDRDDLPDGGASIFADTIRETRARLSACRIEVLIPDFQGSETALRTVLDARPEIIVLALCGYHIDRARRDYELLRRFPKFDSLPATRQGEIYLVEASAYFARPGPRIVDSLEILAGILHPEEFPEFASRGPEDPRSVRVG